MGCFGREPVGGVKKTLQRTYTAPDMVGSMGTTLVWERGRAQRVSGMKKEGYSLSKTEVACTLYLGMVDVLLVGWRRREESLKLRNFCAGFLLGKAGRKENMDFEC